MQAIIRQVAQMTAGVAGVRDQDLVVDPILKSDFQSRGDYGDVGRASDFQSSFIGTFNRYFGSSEDKIPWVSAIPTMLLTKPCGKTSGICLAKFSNDYALLTRRNFVLLCNSITGKNPFFAAIITKM